MGLSKPKHVQAKALLAEHQPVAAHSVDASVSIEY